MAIAQAMCTAFKQELMLGTHNFATNGNAFKLALYAEGGGGKSSTTATLGAATTAYTTTGEIANSGLYTAGGGALTKVAPTTSGTTAFTDFADLSFTTATITAMGALIYNDTNSDKAVCVLDFTSNKTSTSGTFTVQFPTADASNAIIRIALSLPYKVGVEAHGVKVLGMMRLTVGVEEQLVGMMGFHGMSRQVFLLTAISQTGASTVHYTVTVLPIHQIIHITIKVH
jgi:hypothetical protein